MANVANIAAQLDANTRKFDQKVVVSGKKVKTFGNTTRTAKAKLSAYERGLAAGATQSKAMAAATRGTTLAVKSLMAALGPLLAIGTVITAVTKTFNALGDSLERVDKLAKTATKLAITTEDLAGLQLAAQFTGLEITALDKGIQRMVISIAEVASGTGEAKDALESLGLNATALNRLSPDKQFIAIAGAMKQVELRSDKLLIASDLFGTRAAALVNTLDLGRKGLEEITEEAKKFGIAVGEDAARKVEALNDNITRSKKAGEGLANSLTQLVIPTWDKFALRMTSIKIKVREFIDEANKASGTRLALIGLISPMSAFFDLVTGATSATGKLNDSLSKTSEQLKKIDKASQGMKANFTGPRVSAGFAHMASKMGLTVEALIKMRKEFAIGLGKRAEIFENIRKRGSELRGGEKGAGFATQGNRQQFQVALARGQVARSNVERQILEVQRAGLEALRTIAINTGKPNEAVAV